MEQDPLSTLAQELKERLEADTAGTGAVFHIDVAKAGTTSGEVSVVKTKPSGEQVVYVIGKGGDSDVSSQ